METGIAVHVSQLKLKMTSILLRLPSDLLGLGPRPFGLGNLTQKKKLDYPYPTVAISIEDLRRQRLAHLWVLVLGDVAAHPQPLLLPHGDVYFLETQAICFQETDHVLLVLLHLGGMRTGRIG